MSVSDHDQDRQTVLDAFDKQIGWCEKLASPFMARLLTILRDDIAAGGATAATGARVAWRSGRGRLGSQDGRRDARARLDRVGACACPVLSAERGASRTHCGPSFSTSSESITAPFALFLSRPHRRTRLVDRACWSEAFWRSPRRRACRSGVSKSARAQASTPSGIAITIVSARSAGATRRAPSASRPVGKARRRRSTPHSV